MNQNNSQNNLGKILMKVRMELRQQNDKPSLEEILFPKDSSK